MSEKRARCCGASERNTDTSRVGERVHNRMKVQGFETAESRREDAVDLHTFVFADFLPVSVRFRDRWRVP